MNRDLHRWWVRFLLIMNVVALLTVQWLGTGTLSCCTRVTRNGTVSVLNSVCHLVLPESIHNQLKETCVGNEQTFIRRARQQKRRLLDSLICGLLLMFSCFALQIWVCLYIFACSITMCCLQTL